MLLNGDLNTEILSQKTAWSGRFGLDIIQFRHRRFDGTMSGVRTWELFRRGRAAAVLPYDPVRDQVAMIEQFRLPALAAGMAPVLMEIPAGLCEPGEDPALTATRETLEETGLAVTGLHPIGTFLLTAGGADETCALFIGRTSLPETPDPATHGLASEHEDIRLGFYPAQQAIDAALAGEYPNSVTTLALLWLAAKRDFLKQKWSFLPPLTSGEAWGEGNNQHGPER